MDDHAAEAQRLVEMLGEAYDVRSERIAWLTPGAPSPPPVMWDLVTLAERPPHVDEAAARDWLKQICAGLPVLTLPSASGIDGLLALLRAAQRPAPAPLLSPAELTFKSVLEAAPDVILLADHAGRIELVNARAEKFFGWPAASLLGQPVVRLWPERLAAAFSEHWGAFLANPGVQQFNQDLEFFGLRVDGSEFPVEISIGPLLTGPDLRVILVIHDISLRRLAQAQSRDFTAHLHRTLEAERTRIARDVHDVLGSALTGLKLDLANFQREAGVSAEQSASLQPFLAALDETVDLVRQFASHLRPSVLDQMGLNAALEWEFREFQKRTGLRGSLAAPPSEPALDSEVATTIFRVYQEALTNVARHAHASRVEVQFKHSPRELLLLIKDNGMGVGTGALKSGASLGLVGMRERIRLVGGEVAVTSRRGHGTTVTVRVPLPP